MPFAIENKLAQNWIRCYSSQQYLHKVEKGVKGGKTPTNPPPTPKVQKDVRMVRKHEPSIFYVPRTKPSQHF